MIVEKEIRVLKTGRAAVILRVEGLIKLGESAEFFVSALESLLCQEPVLDVAKVDYIDSTGVGEFIGSCVAVARAGRKLALMNVSDRILKLIEIAHAAEDLRVLTMDEAAEYAVSERLEAVGRHAESVPSARTRVRTARDTRTEHGSVFSEEKEAVSRDAESVPSALTRVRTTRDTRSEYGSAPTMQMRVVTFHGDIQEIEYRFFAWRVARKLGLTGWVENMPDGTVVACVAGEQIAIQEWLSDVRDGPFGFHVTLIEQELMDFTGKLQEFEVRS